MFKKAVIGFILLLVAAAASAQETPIAARTIRIATEGAFPPFNYLENNEPQGFEVDLGKALCEAARLTCIFVVHEWDGMIRGLLRQEYDAIMASLFITEKRKARIAFSKPYYRIPASFIARKDGDIADSRPASVSGKLVGVVADSEHVRLLEERYPDAIIKDYSKLEEATLDLLAERLDLVIGDKLALTRFLETREGACCRLVGDAPFDPEISSPGAAIGLRREDAALKEAFDRALDALIADGTYDRIRAKYFPFDTKA